MSLRSTMSASDSFTTMALYRLNLFTCLLTYLLTKMAVMYPYSPPNLVEISSSNLEILTFFKIYYGGRRHLGFS